MQYIENWLLQEKEKAKEFLQKNNFKFNKIKNFFWKKLKFKYKTIFLRIILPEKFPLEYPKFYIDQEEWYLKYPHIEKNKKFGLNICYIENNEKTALFDGMLLIKIALEKIYKIIQNYENNTFDKKDFLNEFDSYWGEKFIYLDAQRILNEPKIINLLEVQKLKEIATTDIEKTKKALKNMKLKILNQKKIIFLPFFDKFTYPFPKTKSAILDIINTLGYKYFLEKYIEHSELKVIFSFKIDDHLHYGAFQFQKPYKQYLIDPEIIPIGIRRIDRNRIFSRGGNFITQKIAETSIEVAIIGCGSLGGSLAFKLAKSGVKKLLLIDYDILTESNIARHICGMRYINEPKVKALKDFLLEQFPDMEIEIFPSNAIECLDRLTQTNLIVSAVGSEGEIFEQLLFQLKHSKNSKIYIPPVVLTWFEGPVAGHAVLIKETDINELSIFFKKISVIENSKKKLLTLLDIGCNSLYSPYAFIDAENVVLHTSLLITDYIKSLGEIEETVITIFNNTNLYNDYLKTEYKNISPYTIQKYKLKEIL
ncbi:ThiF family adenylyltransferase [Nitratiruptor sp. YY09-18]|uniref:ThiF family adenylyltransferase n=1 Tax=Nitratiruptor sp. YY09-18 TaxID=2724901 RepID=UPI001916622E|nr:ThiF family adenylyltransferase [Nitratiruptor sp. YY09-18]BCD67601.1 hypothetical protein NitYY0918_C0500 [Nitratiruptor sp. YY09-18]